MNIPNNQRFLAPLYKVLKKRENIFQFVKRYPLVVIFILIIIFLMSQMFGFIFDMPDKELFIFKYESNGNHSICKFNDTNGLENGLGFFAFFIGFVTLLITFMGLFTTILSLTVAETRNSLFDTRFQMYNTKLELSGKLKDEYENFFENYTDSQYYLRYFYICFIGFSLVMLAWIISNIFRFPVYSMMECLWQAFLIYSTFIICSMVIAIIISQRAADNVLLSKIQHEAVNQLNKKEKANKNNIDLSIDQDAIDRFEKETADMEIGYA